MSVSTEWSAMTSRRRLHMASVTDRATMRNCPVNVYKVDGTRIEEKKDPVILKDFFLSFSSLPPL